MANRKVPWGGGRREGGEEREREGGRREGGEEKREREREREREG